MSKFDDLIATHNLSEPDQLAFIASVVNRYHGSLKQSPETASLLIYLNSKANLDAEKIEYVKKYLNIPGNSHRTFYQCFMNEIDNFLNPNLQENFAINGFSGADLENLTDESKNIVLADLQLASENKDIKFFMNFAAVRLFRDIKSDRFTSREKWEKVLQFFNNNRNQESGVYQAIQNLITPQLFMQSAESRANTQDSADCKKALNILDKITNQLPDKAAIARVRDTANRGLINTATYNEQYPLENRGSAMAHSWSYFKRSVKTGAEAGAGVPLVIGAGAVKYLDIVGFPIALAGLVLGAAGGIAGTLIGCVHGFFKVDMRYPINPSEQSRLLANLKSISDNPDLQERAVAEIHRRYKETKSIVASSKGSSDLYKKLDSNELDQDKKWNAIVEYVARINEGELLINNGKKLFCIIDEVVKSVLGQPSIYSPKCRIN